MKNKISTVEIQLQVNREQEQNLYLSTFFRVHVCMSV